MTNKEKTGLAGESLSSLKSRKRDITIAALLFSASALLGARGLAEDFKNAKADERASNLGKDAAVMTVVTAGLAASLVRRRKINKEISTRPQ